MTIDQTAPDMPQMLAALAARLAALEERVRLQDAELARLRAGPRREEPPPTPAASGLSRRQLLRRMGALIAASAAAGALALPRAALAAPREEETTNTTGEPLLIGRSNSPTQPDDATKLFTPGMTTLSTALMRISNYTTGSDLGNTYYGSGVRTGLVASVSGSDTSTTATRIGIVGITDGHIGVLGRSTSPSGAAVGVRGEAIDGTAVRGVATGGLGWGVYGEGGEYGAIFQGDVAPLRLIEAPTGGPPNAGTHRRGEFFVDNRGELYFCKIGGTPGTWARLTPTTTALPMVLKDR